MCINCKAKLQEMEFRLRDQNNGRTIHEVATQRHMIANLIELIERGTADESFIQEQAASLQERQDAFFLRLAGRAS